MLRSKPLYSARFFGEAVVHSCCRMRITLLNQYFWPDMSAAAQMLSDLAEDLVTAGAQVSVIAGRQSYTGNEQFPATETWRGIAIRRVAGTSLGRGTLWRRGADHATFLVAAVAHLLAEPKIDVVLTATTPPFLPALGLLHKRLRGSKFVYWVHDLFPDAAIELGVLSRDSSTAHTLERISRASLQGTDAIVAIGECMADRIAVMGIPRDRIQVIPNWADGDAIRPVAREQNWFRSQHGLGGKFVVLYSGNMGRGHTFEALVAAARALRHRADIAFVFIGGGPRRAEVERATADLANALFLPYQPREHLAFSIGAADLAVVTLRDEALGTMVPSKLYAYMAAARPVLYVGPRAAATSRTIEAAGCGASFSSTDAAGVAAWITSLAGDRARAAELGRAARRAFERSYRRSLATRRFLDVCRSVLDPRATAASAHTRPIVRGP